MPEQGISIERLFETSCRPRVHLKARIGDKKFFVKVDKEGAKGEDPAKAADIAEQYFSARNHTVKGIKFKVLKPLAFYRDPNGTSYYMTGFF